MSVSNKTVTFLQLSEMIEELEKLAKSEFLHLMRVGNLDALAFFALNAQTTAFKARKSLSSINKNADVLVEISEDSVFSKVLHASEYAKRVFTPLYDLVKLRKRAWWAADDYKLVTYSYYKNEHNINDDVLKDLLISLEISRAMYERERLSADFVDVLKINSVATAVERIEALDRAKNLLLRYVDCARNKRNAYLGLYGGWGESLSAAVEKCKKLISLSTVDVFLNEAYCAE